MKQKKVKFSENNKLHTRLVDIISAIAFAILIVCLFALSGCGNESSNCPQSDLVVVDQGCKDNGNGATVCNPFTYCSTEYGR